MEAYMLRKTKTMEDLFRISIDKKIGLLLRSYVGIGNILSFDQEMETGSEGVHLPTPTTEHCRIDLNDNWLMVILAIQPAP